MVWDLSRFSRSEQGNQEKEALNVRLAALPEAGTEPLLQIEDADIEGWVAGLRAVVERGTVDERRGLLRAWVKRVVANGDALTIEYTFPLVSVADPDGPGTAGAPSTQRTVNRSPRRKPANHQPGTTKGEAAPKAISPYRKKWLRIPDPSRTAPGVESALPWRLRRSISHRLSLPSSSTTRRLRSARPPVVGVLARRIPGQR